MKSQREVEGRDTRMLAGGSMHGMLALTVRGFLALTEYIGPSTDLRN